MDQIDVMVFDYQRILVTETTSQKYTHKHERKGRIYFIYISETKGKVIEGVPCA